MAMKASGAIAERRCSFSRKAQRQRHQPIRRFGRRGPYQSITVFNGSNAMGRTA